MNDHTEVSDPACLPAKPVVSVLMITYNHEPYIEQAIQGIVTQVADFPIELVIGEDCSRDATRSKALAAQQAHPDMVRVVYSAGNLGANRNFQRALALCRGKYVALCEGDDYWNDPQKLSKQVAFLESHPDYVAAYHDVMVVGDKGEVINPSYMGDAKPDYSADELLMTAKMHTLSICFRNVLGPLPQEFFHVVNGDYFLISMLGKHGRAKFMDDIKHGAYRQHAGGIWSHLSQERMDIATLTTFYWLSVYYKRQMNPDASRKFARSLMGKAYRVLELGKPSLLKFFLSMSFHDVYQHGRRAKKFLVAAMARKSRC